MPVNLVRHLALLFFDDARRARRVGVLHMFGALGAMALVGFLMSVLLARMLGDEAVGQINLVRRILQYLLIPAIMGMDLVACRYVAVAPGRTAEHDRTLRFALSRAALSACAVGLACWAALGIWPLVQDPLARGMTRRLVLLLPAMALFDTLLGFLQGGKRVRLYAWVRLARQILLFILTVGAAALWSLRGWEAARFATEIAACAALLVLVRRQLRKDSALCAPPPKREMAAFGLHSMGVSALLSIPYVADFICLDHLLGDNATIGHYAVAWLLIDGLFLAPLAMAKTVFPYTAEASVDPDRLWAHFLRVNRRLWIVVGVVTALALPGAGLIPYIFGAEYAPAVGYFRALLPAFAAQSFAMLARNTTLAAGLSRSTAAGAALVGAVSVALNLVLIGPLGLGAWGAVWASVATQTVAAAAPLAVLLRRRAGQRKSVS